MHILSRFFLCLMVAQCLIPNFNSLFLIHLGNIFLFTRFSQACFRISHDSIFRTKGCVMLTCFLFLSLTVGRSSRYDWVKQSFYNLHKPSCNHYNHNQEASHRVNIKMWNVTYSQINLNIWMEQSMGKLNFCRWLLQGVFSETFIRRTLRFRCLLGVPPEGTKGGRSWDF